MAQEQLPRVFAALQPVLEQYGYLAVGGFVLLEDFGVPVPGEAILIAAAVIIVALLITRRVRAKRRHASA